MNPAILAWISYLRCEATQAEERAKSLRATAAVIEANNNQAADGTKRKRKRDTSKPKRSHTAYTLFVQENYESIKKRHGGEEMASKELLSIVAREWAETGPEEKEVWKMRAEQLKEVDAAATNLDDVNEEDVLPELPSTVDECNKKPAAKKSKASTS